MQESSRALKVGLFAALGIVIVALLLLSFSKSLSILTPTYVVHLRATTVGGLKDRAAVLLAGVTVGNVSSVSIPEDGSRGVLIHLRIQERYKIHADARFAIEQIGFLGDQFVAIYPAENKAPVLPPGAEVKCEEPLNVQDIVRSASGLVQGMTQTVSTVSKMITRLDHSVFSDENLSNLTVAIKNIRVASDKAVVVLDNVSSLIDTNSPSLNRAVTNLVYFSDELNRLSYEMRQTVSTNRAELSAAVKNFESISAVLDRLLKDVDSGHGLAGALVRDDTLKVDLKQIASNFSNLSSNLNRYGLLYKPKPPKPHSTRDPVYTGRSPLRP